MSTSRRISLGSRTAANRRLSLSFEATMPSREGLSEEGADSEGPGVFGPAAVDDEALLDEEEEKSLATK